MSGGLLAVFVMMTFYRVCNPKEVNNLLKDKNGRKQS
jgi:hypothetical protein